MTSKSYTGKRSEFKNDMQQKITKIEIQQRKRMRGESYVGVNLGPSGSTTHVTHPA